jgi:hypothetical protein
MDLEMELKFLIKMVCVSNVIIQSTDVKSYLIVTFWAFMFFREAAGDHEGPPNHSSLFSIQHCNDAVASSAAHSAVLQGLPSPLQ